MPNPTCSTCPFWACDPADRSDASERPCRVRPPATWTAPHREQGPERDAMWPYTRANDWCSEHPLHPAQRERVALAAMQGLLTSQRVYLLDPGVIARDAYRIALAMEAERERISTPNANQEVAP